MTSGYMTVLSYMADWSMLLLAPNLDKADPLFALAITPGFYLHHAAVAHQDPARGNL